MSKSDVFENDILKLIFNNVAIAGIGDAGGLLPSTVAGSLYLTLCTADPGDIGTAITNETTYTGYARKAVARATGASGFTVTNNSVSPTSDQDFPECTAVPGSPATFFGVVASASGAGKLLYKGTLTPNIPIAVGMIPRIKSTTTITED